MIKRLPLNPDVVISESHHLEDSDLIYLGVANVVAKAVGVKGYDFREEIPEGVYEDLRGKAPSVLVRQIHSGQFRLERHPGVWDVKVFPNRFIPKGHFNFWRSYTVDKSGLAHPVVVSHEDFEVYGLKDIREKGHNIDLSFLGTDRVGIPDDEDYVGAVMQSGRMDLHLGGTLDDFDECVGMSPRGEHCFGRLRDHEEYLPGSPDGIRSADF